MPKNKLYTGFLLENDTIKIARISVSGKKATLEKIDKIKLVDPILKKSSEKEAEEVFDTFDEFGEDDDIFGGDIEDSDEFDLDLDLDNLDDTETSTDDLDLDLDNLDDDILDVDDMAAEADEDVANSNEMLIYNVLNDLDSSSVKMSLNIPAGASIFQVLKDIDFSKTKKKDLNIIVDDRLESLYGSVKSSDYYSTSIRDDGSLLLVSIDDEPQILDLINSSENLYSGKIIINDVLPDESLIIGLFRANYEVESQSITALIQYSEENCRIVFLKGNELLLISPMIIEGSSSRKFLNTVFSKILFQLDTGEVPNLDRIILCNNSLGEEAISFFDERFPDIEVSEFIYKDELFDTKELDESTISSFTTAIALAWADAGFMKSSFPDVSFLPTYIKERQKIFKLQWHGFLLLALIILVFPISNYFYLGYASQLENLNDSIENRKVEIRSLETTVQEYNRISTELSGIQSQLVLLDELSKGILKWTVNLDLVNKGIDNIDSIWLTSFQQSGEDGIEITGIALYRNRIPMVADIFSQAILKDVQKILIREKEVYQFSYEIPRVVANKERYTPESAKGLKEVLGGN